MAVTRYDQRKNYEEAEANSMGIAYVRADLLPDADAAQVRALLKTYLKARVQFYTALDPQQLAEIDAETVALQDQMWAAVRSAAAAQATPITAPSQVSMTCRTLRATRRRLGGTASQLRLGRRWALSQSAVMSSSVIVSPAPIVACPSCYHAQCPSHFC